MPQGQSMGAYGWANQAIDTKTLAACTHEGIHMDAVDGWALQHRHVGFCFKIIPKQFLDRGPLQIVGLFSGLFFEPTNNGSPETRRHVWLLSFDCPLNFEGCALNGFQLHARPGCQPPMDYWLQF